MARQFIRAASALKRRASRQDNGFLGRRQIERRQRIRTSVRPASPQR